MTTPLSSFSGVASGFNYSSLVDAIINQASEPLTALQARQTAITTRDQAIATYGTLLTALQTAAQGLSNGNALSNSTASMSQLTGTTTLATVATTGPADAGTHTLQVSQLAQAAKLGSTTQSSSTTALGLAGAFTVNGASVTVASTDTLANVRDKINALNGGATPSGVTASILSVSPTDQRLVLTSTKTGSAGIALVDTTGTALQSLGFLDSTDAPKSSAVLAQGLDAKFTLDTIAFTRSSNVVNDAIGGLTLTLTAADTSSSNQITVAGDVDGATSAVQNFTSAYNATINFLQQQNTVPSGGTPPPLYNDSLVRNALAALPSDLLQAVPGAASNLATMASIGVHLQSDGTLTFDTSAFATAYQSQPAAVAQLFEQNLTAADPQVNFVSSGPGTTGGSWDVNITAPATQASVTTTGFSGVYDAGATPDTVNVTDDGNGKSVHVALTTGMTSADIVTALQSAFTAAGLNITASTSGTDITLTHTSFGSSAGITVSATGTGDGASEAWNASSTVYGTDVAGTIGGQAATGSGQLLVGNSQTTSAGLTVRYTGTTARDTGNVTASLGTGAVVMQTLNAFLAPSSGFLAQATSADADQNSFLTNEINAMQARLTLQRAALMAEYANMESAISALQSQGGALLAGLNGGTSSSSSSTPAPAAGATNASSSTG